MNLRKLFTFIFLAGLVTSLAGCQSIPMPFTGAAQPAALPLTGKNASRLGAAALTIQQTAGTEEFNIVPVAADTGKPVPSAKSVELGGVIAYAFAADREQMAFLSNRSSGCLGYCLHLMDLRSWKETVKPMALEEGIGSWLVLPGFRANSTRLPIILNDQTETTSQVQLVDLAQGKFIQKARLNANIIQAVYTPGGALAVYGIKSNPAAQQSFVYLGLLDGADLHPLWEQDLTDIRFVAEWAGDHNDPTQGQYLNPAGVFSADGSRLYIAAADKPLLVTVDFSKRALQRATIQPKGSLLDQLMARTAGVVYAKTLNGISKAAVLSADERYLYVVGQESTAVKAQDGSYTQSNRALGLEVIDTRDGTLVKTIPTEANNLALSMDGKMLLLTGWKDVQGAYSLAWTDVLDTTSWEVSQRLEGNVLPTRLLDGSLAWLVTSPSRDSNQIQVYRPGGSAPLSQVSGPNTVYLDWIPIP